jgi:hypothetical protein
MALDMRDKVLLGCAGLLAVGLISGGYLLGDGLKRAWLKRTSPQTLPPGRSAIRPTASTCRPSATRSTPIPNN